MKIGLRNLFDKKSFIKSSKHFAGRTNCAKEAEAKSSSKSLVYILINTPQSGSLIRDFYKIISTYYIQGVAKSYNYNYSFIYNSISDIVATMHDAAKSSN